MWLILSNTYLTDFSKNLMRIEWNSLEELKYY